MRRRSVLSLAVVLLCASGLAFSSVGAQKYAPVVGAWRIELTMEKAVHTLELETDGQGRWGRGTGSLVVLAADEGAERVFPVAWDNVNPQSISISGEVALPVEGARPRQGTLILRAVWPSPGAPMGTTALFVDDEMTTSRGTFTMTRTKGPEEVRQGSLFISSQ